MDARLARCRAYAPACRLMTADLEFAILCAGPADLHAVTRQSKSPAPAIGGNLPLLGSYITALFRFGRAGVLLVRTQTGFERVVGFFSLAARIF